MGEVIDIKSRLKTSKPKPDDEFPRLTEEELREHHQILMALRLRRRAEWNLTYLELNPGSTFVPHPEVWHISLKLTDKKFTLVKA